MHLTKLVDWMTTLLLKAIFSTILSTTTTLLIHINAIRVQYKLDLLLPLYFRKIS